ncbi:MAG TPA: host attachment protein [Parachlamydiaceae bacterium]|nr:host attachment protein [Parachlamydiaceae bacterium]
MKNGKNDVWVVVANSTLARIFKAETIHRLKELETLIHPASRQHAKDLVSDKPGRTFESIQNGTRHAMEPKTNPQQVEFEEFAKFLSKYLDTACNDGLYKKLYLAANPLFLGLLRQHLKPKTMQLIKTQIDKDFTHMTPNELPKHFDLIL